jgi:hypothetical protein
MIARGAPEKLTSSPFGKVKKKLIRGTRAKKV